MLVSFRRYLVRFGCILFQISSFLAITEYERELYSKASEIKRLPHFCFNASLITIREFAFTRSVAHTHTHTQTNQQAC